ncbi:hypothetical protein A0H81_10190 [Grifola frondosa]|uniref:Transmembrane protein n=1 Tax=Grifola frondosa TaxID=5627 RepID=A0A1C7LYA9_GRIFR|nr:hypothetical protein A0H81_10190 [Grifola frondosa]
MEDDDDDRVRSGGRTCGAGERRRASESDGERRGERWCRRRIEEQGTEAEDACPNRQSMHPGKDSRFPSSFPLFSCLSISTRLSCLLPVFFSAAPPSSRTLSRSPSLLLARRDHLCAATASPSMSNASPTAFLLWAILSVLFQIFLVHHLWCYDNFKCLRWSAGRQPGAFKRLMTYSYLCSVPMFVVYSVAMTVIKYKEGALRSIISALTSPLLLTISMLTLHRLAPPVPSHTNPIDLYRPPNKDWVTPRLRLQHRLGTRTRDTPRRFVLSVRIFRSTDGTSNAELAFWLYLLHQNPHKEAWFSSWEYRLWQHDCDHRDAADGARDTEADGDVRRVHLPGRLRGVDVDDAVVLVRVVAVPAVHPAREVGGRGPGSRRAPRDFYQLNVSASARVQNGGVLTADAASAGGVPIPVHAPLLVLALDGIVGTAHVVNRNLFWTDFLQMIAGIGCFLSTMITLLIFPTFDRQGGGVQAESIQHGSTVSQECTHHAAIAHRTVHIAPNLHAHPAYGQPTMHTVAPARWEVEVTSSAVYESAFGTERSHEQDLDDEYDPEQGPEEPAEDGMEEERAPPYPLHLYQRHPFPHSLSSPQILVPPPSPPPPSPFRIDIAPPPPTSPKHASGELRRPRSEGVRRGLHVVASGPGTPPVGVGLGVGNSHMGSRRASILHPYVRNFLVMNSLAQCDRITRPLVSSIAAPSFSSRLPPTIHGFPICSRRAAYIIISPSTPITFLLLYLLHSISPLYLYPGSSCAALYSVFTTRYDHTRLA